MRYAFLEPHKQASSVYIYFPSSLSWEVAELVLNPNMSDAAPKLSIILYIM